MTSPEPTLVVVGSGIAGLTAALHAAEAGVQVTVLTKRALEDTATAWAQGGIAGVTSPGDSVDAHVADTLLAGAGLADEAVARAVAGAGGAAIAELISRGVAFDTDDAGRLVHGLEGAHSYPRIVHAGGDATGREIQRALVRAVRRVPAITVRENVFALDVVRRDGRVGGIRLLADSGEVETLYAEAVVLATGGAGRLFAHTTNPDVATGDGVAMAIRVGAEVADLEFVQFHPTVLAAGAPFLVSEAVRGEGAVLIDDDGERFALRSHPAGELAPRDVVARAIADAMARQGGRPVHLDATGLRGSRTACARFLAARFPTIDRAVRERGLDWSREPIPVTPAAHYLMGGVVTDLDGRTSLPGLYAAGETARTGLHGANRLASNSLLEGLVFGARVAAAARADLARVSDPATSSAPRGHLTPDAASHPGSQRSAPAEPVTAPTEPDAAFSRAALQRLMWTHAGLRRDAGGLARASAVVAAWRDAQIGGSPATPAVPASASSAPTVAEAEDANLLLVAAHVLAAAGARTTSVGAHFRSDDAAARPGHRGGMTASDTPHPLELTGAPC